VKTTFSKIFEINGRLEIGQIYQDWIFFFFQKAVTVDSQRPYQSATVPLKLMLIKSRRSGPMISTICLKKVWRNE